jgi:hypothetical protein
VLVEGLDKLKEFNDFIGFRTRDLPGCSIVPQPSTLPQSPTFFVITFYLQYIPVHSANCVKTYIQCM